MGKTTESALVAQKPQVRKPDEEQITFKASVTTSFPDGQSLLEMERKRKAYTNAQGIIKWGLALKEFFEMLKAIFSFENDKLPLSGKARTEFMPRTRVANLTYNCTQWLLLVNELVPEFTTKEQRNHLRQILGPKEP